MHMFCSWKGLVVLVASNRVWKQENCLAETLLLASFWVTCRVLGGFAEAKYTSGESPLSPG